MNYTLQIISEIHNFAERAGNEIQLRGFKTGGTEGQIPVKGPGGDFDWSWTTVTLPDLNDVQEIGFNLTPTDPSIVEGFLKWSDDEGCLCYGIAGGAISIGKEVFEFYTNGSGGNLVDGDVVSVISATGNRCVVDLTDPTDPVSVAACVGMVTDGPVSSNNRVRVTLIGEVHNLNTSALDEGKPVYVDPANPGKLTKTRPSAPNGVVEIGMVEVKNASVGVIVVHPRISARLQDLGDVNGTPLTTDGQIYVWDDTLGVWDATANINSYALKAGNNTYTGLSDYSSTATFSYHATAKAAHRTALGLGTEDDPVFRTVTLAVVTVSGLPPGSLGMQILVSDADAPVVGNTVAAGAGADKLVQCIHNGTNWIVTAILT